jgi:hypothetical protein
MKRRGVITVVVLTIVISNLFSGYINIFTEGLFKWYTFQTENGEFAFSAMPSKGRDTEVMERQFSSFKENNPKYSGLIIYRTFRRNPLKFWNWYDYISNPLYRYPFKEYIEIESLNL